MSQKNDRKENFYKYLEDSVCSNPESIYIDTEESKVSFCSSMSFAIIDNYFSDGDNNHNNNNNLKFIPKEIKPEQKDDLKVFPDENKDKDKDQDKDQDQDQDKDHEIYDKLSSCNDFFDYYNKNLSINNVVPCENLDKSTIFDENETILDDNINPFDEHDVNFYDVDKNKHKGKKNLDKLGMVTLSAVVLIGSTWINKYFG